jgi:hypothetical protein
MPDLIGDWYVRVLERLHTVLAPKSYLEIGVEKGTTLALARCPSIGIDPQFRFESLELVQQIVAKPSLFLFQIPSDDFFARFDPEALLGNAIDFAFLDGMHHCEFLLRDFRNIERHALPGSVIALHDCMPCETPIAERERYVPTIDKRRQDKEWAGDVWRTALLLKRYRPDLRMIVIDASPTGLVLLTNLNPHNSLIADNEQELVNEMKSWSLEKITVAGYFEEMEMKSEGRFRRPEQIRAWWQAGV